MAETRYVGPSASNCTYVCDGTSDEVQINQALAWAASNPNNTVYLRGPFTYDIRNPLGIGNYTEFTGDATAKLRLYNNASSSVWYKQIHMIKQSAGVAKGIKIHGFEIDGNRWNQSGSEGDGLHNAIGLRGNSNDPGTGIEVYDMYIHDSLGDGVRLQYIQDGIKIYNNRIEVMGHEGVFLIQCSGAEVYKDSMKQKCNSCVRTDNCKKVKIYENVMNKSGYSSGAGNGAIQIGDEPDEYGLTWLTQEVEVYNNEIYDGAGSGILLMDAWRTAGTDAQTVHIHHNKLVGCGWSYSYKYNAAISCWYWGNGAVIEHNTIEGSYNAGLLIYDGYSGCKIQVNDNNITGTKKTQATLAERKLPVSGYGVLNMVPSKISVRLEDNYISGNVSGNYYQVTPLTEAGSLVPNALPTTGSGGTPTEDDEDNDIVDPDTGIVIPAIRRLQKDDSHEYIPGWSGYIDDAPFRWFNKQLACAKSYGQDKIPGAPGWALTDFHLEGSELVLDCAARSLQELFRAAASLRKQGRITVELGGDFAGYQASGILGDYSSDLKLRTTIPRKWHPYSFMLLMDLPCYESVLERIRSRYISASCQFSASNCYKGNVISNSSFETWALNQSFSWNAVTNPADVNFKRIRWSKDLRMFCAVANSGTGNRVLLYETSWRQPYGLTNANRNNDWGGLCWCSDWTLWIAMATAGTAGYLCMTSPDTDNWTAKATPAGANGFAWESGVFIPPSGTFTTGRVIFFASAGTGNRVIYSDDQCTTWTQVASAINTNAWSGGDYSPKLDRVCCVARSGSTTQRVMISNDKGATWTAQDCPAQAWESVRWISGLSLFVACSSNGTQQIMTSPTGLSGSWTLRDTPVLGDYVIPGTGTDVQTINYVTQTGINYSTFSTSYNDDAGVPNRVIPALTNGHIWRLARVFCSLRAQNSGSTAYCRVTIQAASLYGGVETKIAEWTETSTEYKEKSLALSIESATNETVTLRFWGKTSSASSKAVISLAGCEVVEFNGSGGSTIGYTRGQYKDIEYAPELNTIVCVSQVGVADDVTGQGNGIMYSTSAIDWIACQTPTNNANQSVAYSDHLNMFAVVANSGNGNRILVSNSFGDVLGPENWNLGEGATRCEDTAIDGIYSLQITGDGVTAVRGLTTQKISISPGERQILSGYCTVSGLTAGSARLDIISGSMVIKELNFAADGDWTPKQISFKQNVVHDDVYVRVYGYNLNAGAIIKFDKLLVEKASDFEEAATGTGIATFGTEDVIPDVIINATEYNPDGSAAGETITYTSPRNVSQAASTIQYVRIASFTLPARTDGTAYKLDRVFSDLRSAVSNYGAFMQVSVQAMSKNLGNEYKIAEWVAGGSLDFAPRSSDIAIVFAENEEVTIRYYLKSINTAGRAEAIGFGYTYTELSYGFTSTENLYLWNNADTSKVMKCCNKLLPGYTMEINRDGTGSLTYSENFLNESILYLAVSSSGVTYDSANNSLVFAQGGNIVLPFDCMCPISGVPFASMFVVAGNPQLSIALDSTSVPGTPGTFYHIDGDLSVIANMAEMYRLLNHDDEVILNNETVFYLKIEPYGFDSCEISSLYVEAKISTIDVERFKIYKGGGANTIGVQVDDRCSAVISLRYHDCDPAV